MVPVQRDSKNSVATDNVKRGKMTSKEPKKKYFKPKKPVNKMTEEEINEFAQFVFDKLMRDVEDSDNDPSQNA